MSLEKLQHLAEKFDIDLGDGSIQLVSGRQIREAFNATPFAGGSLPISTRWPVVIDARAHGIDAAAVGFVLARHYAPDHEIIVQTSGEGSATPSTRTRISGIATMQTVVLGGFIPPLQQLDAVRDPRTLQHIVARLRRPDGCPWDRKQSNESLRAALIDEVYEAADAIDAGDMENLAEELGDLFLLIAMHAQIAEEHGHFSIEDVYEGIATKIIRRHPHVFGDEAAEHADDVVGLWQEIKAQEHAGGKANHKDADGQPRAMPALERAVRVLRKTPLEGAAVADDASGDRLLAIIAGIIDVGGDPDIQLREALDRHVATSETSSAGSS